MAAKFVVALFAQAVLIQCALSQFAPGLAGPWGVPGPALGPGLGAPYGAGCGCGGVSSTGGGFPVTSVSPIAPTGISVFSENAIEGPLAVGGSLPFLGTVSVEGVLPTAGVGTVSYGCGNGAVGIVSEGPIATGIVGPAPYAGGPAYAPAAAAYGPYNGLAGYGCGAIY